MSASRTVCFIEARMRSERLPGKVLAPLGGLPMLEHLVRRARAVSGIDAIVIATSTDPANDPLEALANRLGIGCFRGSEDDVLARIVEAARAFQSDVIVELTGDNPAIDPRIVEEVLRTYRTGNYDYVSNTLERTFPRGMSVQVFSRRVLEESAALTQDPSDREHVTLFIQRHPERYRLHNVASALPESERHVRLTVDTPEDLTLMREVFAELHGADPLFGLDAILALLRRKPELREINAHVNQKLARTWNALVVGAGRIGAGPTRSHAAVLAGHPHVKLTAICDTDAALLERMRQAYRVEADTDAARVCARVHPDVIVICTPTESHATTVHSILDRFAPRLFLLEKPMTESSREAADLLSRARAEGSAVAVNYTRRFLPVFQEFARAIALREYGEPKYARFTYANGILNNGSHAIDLARMFFGDVAAVKRTDAAASRAPLAAGPGGPTKDATIDAELCFSNGLRVRLEGFDAQTASIFEGDIFFDRARVRFDVAGTRWERFRLEEGVIAPGHSHYVSSGHFEARLEHAFAHVYDAVAAHLENGAPLPCTGEDALETLRIIESLRSGGGT